MNEREDDTRDQPPDAGVEHASTLALLCSGPQPPQPFEVLRRIEDAGYAIELLSEDGPGNAVWGRALKLDANPHPVFIWCQARDEAFKPWEWMPARWRDENEFELASSSRWLLLLKTSYEPDDEPNSHYHDHLRLADAVANGLAAACVDMYSSCLRSRTTLHELAQCKVAPAPEEMYQVQTVSKDDLFWLRTQGLRRFEVPELELIGVPRENLHDAYTAFQWLVAYVLPLYVPIRGLDLDFGANVSIRLMPGEPVIAEMPIDALGGAAQREGDSPVWRMLVSDRRRDGKYSIRRFLKSVTGDPIFWLSDDESVRRAKLARVRFGHAAAAWYSSQWQKRRMGVKIGVPFNDIREDLSAALDHDQLPKGASREHMWFELQAIDGKTLVGKLESQPVYATYLTRGEIYRLPLTQLSEFNLTLDDQSYNPATIAELDLVTLRTGK
jgi:uncharacterized protein YegJ (DUF2314 family)